MPKKSSGRRSGRRVSTVAPAATLLHQADAPSQLIPSTSTCRDTVFSTPELRAIINSYLSHHQLNVLSRTCRAWYDLWMPDLYKVMPLANHTSRKQYPKFTKYGQFVQTLHLTHTKARDAIHLVKRLPNLRHLHFSTEYLSHEDSRDLLSSVPAHLSLLDLGVRDWDRTETSSECLLGTITGLPNLQSLIWSAPRMCLHVDDFLNLMKRCPRLTSLDLRSIKVVYLDSGSQVDAEPFIPADTRSDPPNTLDAPITPDSLYIGRQLQKIHLYNMHMSDEGLMRLLGFESSATTDHTPSHSLTHFTVNYCQSLTYRSCARILEECDRLEAVVLSCTTMSTLGVFQGNTPWLSAPSIKKLSLDIQPEDFDPIYYSNYALAIMDHVPAPTTEEQHQVQSRLQSLTNLRYLTIAGYAAGPLMVQDISPAGLQSVEVTIVSHISQPVNLLPEEWIKTQQHGWQWTYCPGSAWGAPFYKFKFSRADANKQKP
ncbi:hypothetical protein BGZ94_001473 [Podila epigama]|nr:hypothetical protein BGZ94_001473 [Podila epigama]